MIWLWSGFHSEEIAELVRQTWSTDDLLILCPTSLKDFSFILGLHSDLQPNFYSERIEIRGEWDDITLGALELQLTQNKAKHNHPGPWGFSLKKPVLGLFTSGTTSGKHRLILYSKENIQDSLN